MIRTTIFSLVLIFISNASHADEIRIAVASNFKATLLAITELFESTTTHRVILSPGSTGKHYAQITHGAPFDVFLAADTRRPELLEQSGITLPGSRFTYAIGKLVLWSNNNDYIDTEAKTLNNGQFRHLAIANPKHAPYGIAAQQTLASLDLWNPLRQRIVLGENIAQTFQFVSSGNAELGFVAFSQIILPDQSIKGSYWLVPQSLYTPIEQQAILLKDNEASRDFLSFMRSKNALKIIAEYGYDTP